MNKKYFPFIALLGAILIFIWVKKNQRGVSKYKTPTTQTGNATEPLSRDTAIIEYSRHAKCRMECRHIDESEVKEILLKGQVNYNKIEESSKGKSYPLEGVTHDRQHVRIVFAPHDNKLVVVTVVDLDKEWECDCK
ncbi:MAG TPA: DUF4258 domain-containing protein [Ferruginibacter sp.]|nr:DUF4258 domain-containing protein [Ferruginibacter sp.]